VTVSTSGAQSFQVEAFRRSTPTQDPNDTSTTGDLTATSASSTFTVMAKPAPSPTASSTSAAGDGKSTGTGDGTGTSSTATPDPGATAYPGTTAEPSTGTTSSPRNSQNPSGAVSQSPGAPTLGHTVTGPQAVALSNGFQNFAAPAGIDKLPPLPLLNQSSGSGQTGASADDGEPTDQGTFKLSLGYAPQTTTSSTTSTTTPLSSVADALGVSPMGLWRSVAGSLVLLLGAAHVRRFARSAPE
jgi:hypothetical protein